jgi:hypothetical protein
LFFLGVLCAVYAQPVLTGYDQFVNLTGTLFDQLNAQPSNLFYGVYYSIRQTSIDIGIVCDVTGQTPFGWCGFGISLSGLMIGNNQEQSDAIVGYVDDLNNFFIGDFVIRGRNPPINCAGGPSVCIDSFHNNCSDNVVPRSGSRQGNFLIMEFTRPVGAADSCDVAINFQSNFIIYVIGNTLEGLNFPDNIINHDIRGPQNALLTFVPPGTTGLGAGSTTGAITSGSPTTGAITSGADVTTGVPPAVTTGVAPPVTTGAVVTTGAAPPVTTAAEETTTTEESSLSATLVIPAFLMIVLAYFF